MAAELRGQCAGELLGRRVHENDDAGPAAGFALCHADAHSAQSVFLAILILTLVI